MIIQFCGKIAVLVACAIILFVILLVLLAGFCIVWGAYDSFTNPNASGEAKVEYQEVMSELKVVNQSSISGGFAHGRGT